MQKSVSSSDSLVFERQSQNGYEQLKFNFKKGIFTFKSERENKFYVANGFINQSNILVFPAYSEFDDLSPFKKGYYELNKIDTSSEVSFEIKAYDLQKSPVENVIILCTKEKNFNKAENSNPKINHLFNYLAVTYGYHKELFIEMPKPGKYELNVYLQEPITYSMYAMSENGCAESIYSPELPLYICKKEEDLITEVSLTNCIDVFKLKK